MISKEAFSPYMLQTFIEHLLCARLGNSEMQEALRLVDWPDLERPWSPGVGKGVCLPLTGKKGRGGFLGTPKKARLRAAPQRL